MVTRSKAERKVARGEMPTVTDWWNHQAEKEKKRYQREAFQNIVNEAINRRAD